jgi:type II secretory pathway component PulJ
VNEVYRPGLLRRSLGRMVEEMLQMEAAHGREARLKTRYVALGRRCERVVEELTRIDPTFRNDDWAVSGRNHESDSTDGGTGGGG